MRIAYITQTRFPTEKAHGHQVAQVCHAMAGLGHEVTLLAPTIWNDIRENAFEYYGLPHSFAIEYPGSFDALGSSFVPGPLGFIVGMWSYGRVLRRYLRHHSFDLLYARSPALLRPLLHSGIPLILELHTLPHIGISMFARRCNRCLHVVCLTSLMRDELVRLGVHPQKIIVEGDGVDLSRFEHLPSVDQAKEQWSLPSGIPVAAYVGSLITQGTIEKGVMQLIEALVLLKQKKRSVFCWIVGGPEEWKKRYESEAQRLGLGYDDIRFQGAIPSAQVPGAVAASDLCIYPAPASSHPFFRRDTSPLKLFEYLAAGKPIVCADLPPIRDIVDASVVRFCPPGDAQAMADGIEQTLQDFPAAQEKAARGKEIAAQHSWTQRMRRILEGDTDALTVE